MSKTEGRPTEWPMSFTEAIKISNEQQRQRDEILLSECKKHWKNEDIFPFDLLRKFAWSAKAQNWLEEHHPFFPIFDAMSQIKTALKMLVQARESLIKLYGHYHAALLHDGFEITEEVTWKSTHEVFKYVFAASALVQAYRRFLSFDIVDRDGYERARKTSFHDTELMEFIKKLRNCYGHQMLLSVSPAGTISYGENIKVESALTFDRERLLSLRDSWNSEAKFFLERRESLNVLEIISEYHKMASTLHHSYGSATGVIHTTGYREFIRCKQALISARYIMSLNILLQGAEARRTDPYAHLDKYFSDEELVRIHCLPSHSREQVDFMIDIRDPLGFCDEDLRKKLYKVFSC